jgi:integrase
VEFRGHDLRRTAASLMVGAGVPRLVVQKILNHAETGVTAVYGRHSYDLEKRSALDYGGGVWRRSSRTSEAQRC